MCDFSMFNSSEKGQERKMGGQSFPLELTIFFSIQIGKKIGGKMTLRRKLQTHIEKHKSIPLNTHRQTLKNTPNLDGKT